MTPRERMLAAFEFADPDRIPVYYHPSQAGLYVHGEKLLELFNRYEPDNPIVFDTIPTPPEGTVDLSGNYHELRKNQWGVTEEYRIFGIQGQPAEYPFNGWEEARDYSFPPLPKIGSEGFSRFKSSIEEQKKEYLVKQGWISIFMQLYNLQPMDEVLMDIYTGEPGLLDFLDRLTDYWGEHIRYLLAAGAEVIMLADDWCTQSSQLISTELFREHFKPRYERLMQPIKDAGKRVFFHMCGAPAEIFGELLDLGIDGIWPQIPLYDMDWFSKTCREHKVTTYLHPDRQHLIPKGTPGEIERTIAEYAERYHNLGGGAIFYVEIENDAPFANVKSLIESIHKYR